MNEYHYIMAVIPNFGGLKKLQRQISEEVLYTAEPGYGRELNSHITIIYGLHNEADFFDIRRMLYNYKNIPVTLTTISKFSEEHYDVIKIDVISDVCHQLHNQVKNECNSTQTYDSYNPHVTLAYVLPGSCDELLGVEVNEEFKLKECEFWHKEGYMIPLQVGRYGKTI